MWSIDQRGDVVIGELAVCLEPDRIHTEERDVCLSVNSNPIDFDRERPDLRQP